MSDPTVAASDWPGLCFGCSPRNPVGLRLRAERTANGCVATHTLAEHFCGIEGIAHGGIVGTLLDEVAAWALVLHTGKLGITTEMNTRFVLPVKTGVLLHLEAWVGAADSRRANTRAEVRSDDGSVLASATADWVLASAAVVARMSGLDRERVEAFFTATAGEVPADSTGAHEGTGQGS